ncbi:MAG: MgtC/SapB transporter, partial [Acidimicrobiia bacterium]|nr:MgtC/SapB transporter [Acidimicrobiia bacterium]
LSTANLVNDGLSTTAAARAILIAAAVNTVVKAGLAASLGNKRLRSVALLTLGPAALIGVVAAFVL